MKYKKVIIGLVLFIVFTALASFVYNKLSVSYEPKQSSISGQEIKKASDFTVVNESGQIAKLSDFKGKPTIVNFWATWCGPCKSEMPAFESIYTRYKDDVNIMMVNLTDNTNETVKKVKEFISQNGYTFPVFFDTSAYAAKTYRVTSVPMTLFIDKNGNLINSHTGAMTEKMLNNYVIQLIGG